VRVVAVLRGALPCLRVIYALIAGGITEALLVFAHRSIAATENVHHGCAYNHGKIRVHLTGRSHGMGFESGKTLTVQTPAGLIFNIASIEARHTQCCKQSEEES
jgi:hypothetical protein